MKLARKSILTLAAILIAAVLTVSVFAPAATASDLTTDTGLTSSGAVTWNDTDRILTVTDSSDIDITGAGTFNSTFPIKLIIQTDITVTWKAYGTNTASGALITIPANGSDDDAEFRVELGNGNLLKNVGPVIENKSTIPVSIISGTLESTNDRTNTVYSKGNVSVGNNVTKIIASGDNSVGVYAENNVNVINGAKIEANEPKGKAVYSKSGNITLDGTATDIKATQGGPAVEARNGDVTIMSSNVVVSGGSGTAIRASGSVVTNGASTTGAVEANYDYPASTGEGSGSGMGCDAGFGAGGLLLLAGTALLGRG
jgi:hypothetical protein